MYGNSILLGFECCRGSELSDLSIAFDVFMIEKSGDINADIDRIIDSGIDGVDKFTADGVQDSVVNAQKKVLCDFLKSSISKETLTTFTVDGIEYWKARVCYIDEELDDSGCKRYIGIEVSGCYYPMILDYGISGGGFAPGLTDDRKHVLEMFIADLEKTLPRIREAYLCFPLQHY